MKSTILIVVVSFGMSMHDANGQTDTSRKSVKITEAYNENDYKPDFSKADTVPTFPGGQIKWRIYLEQNLDFMIPIEKKAPAGTYKVVVNFKVDTAGNLSNFKALTKYGYGMEKEAIRFINEGPRWVPARRNGKLISSDCKQTIAFVVTTD